MHYVYISGPIQGDGTTPREVSSRTAIMAAGKVLEAGFVPFIPHLNILWNMLDPKPESVWMKYDLAWIGRCDCLLRLPGASRGSDAEVAHARARGIPVFYSIEELIEARDDDLLPLGRPRKGTDKDA